ALTGGPMADGTIARKRPPIDGDSPAIHELRKQIARAAKIDWPVLILGEQGTGKELVAYELHSLSDRPKAPYVIVNLGSLNPSTRNSELFGHERHAFTGADRAKPGLFRAADKGSVFLDEIGNSDPDLQASLLRVLEYGEITPVGGAENSVHVEVRVIAAT